MNKQIKILVTGGSRTLGSNIIKRPLSLGFKNIETDLFLKAIPKTTKAGPKKT